MIPNWKLHGQGYCTWEYGKLLSLYIFVRGFQGSWYFAWSWSREIQVNPGNPAKFTITFKIPRNSGEFLSNTRWYNIFEAFFFRSQAFNSAATEPGTQCKDYRISAAHDQNTENSSHEEGGGGGIQCTVSYRNWLTDSLLSDTHNSVKFGKHSRFSSMVICWPIRVRLCRLGKFSMPIIFGKPEKNISKDLTFFPDPFCNFSNLTPFTVHYRQKKWAARQ